MSNQSVLINNYQEIKAKLKELKITPFIYFTHLTAILIKHLVLNDKFLLGTVVSNRTSEQPHFGNFTNTILIPIDKLNIATKKL